VFLILEGFHSQKSEVSHPGDVYVSVYGNEKSPNTWRVSRRNKSRRWSRELFIKSYWTNY